MRAASRRRERPVRAARARGEARGRWHWRLATELPLPKRKGTVGMSGIARGLKRKPPPGPGAPAAPSESPGLPVTTRPDRRVGGTRQKVARDRLYQQASVVECVQRADRVGAAAAARLRRQVRQQLVKQRAQTVQVLLEEREHLLLGDRFHARVVLDSGVVVGDECDAGIVHAELAGEIGL